MWTAALLLALALAHGGHGFIMYNFVVPAAPEYGSTVTLEANYRLNRGEYIREMRWLKDNTVFMVYSQLPEENYKWNPVPGLNIDTAASTAASVVIRDVGDSASGIYTMELEVGGPGGGVSSIINSQSMDVGGRLADGLGTRFGGVNTGGSTFVSSSSSSFGLPFSGSFFTQTSSAGDGGLITRFGGTPGPRVSVVNTAAGVDPAEASETVRAAVANAQAQIQNAIAQVNEIQRALANLG